MKARVCHCHFCMSGIVNATVIIQNHSNEGGIVSRVGTPSEHRIMTIYLVLLHWLCMSLACDIVMNVIL